MQNQTDNIEHPGIIEKIEGNTAWVTIMPQSACGNCHSKSYCGMAEIAEKQVKTALKPEQKFTKGQQVTVALQKSLGYRALLLGYILPFLLVLVCLIVSLSVTKNELYAALISVASMVPYFGILYLRRDSIKSAFRFYIKS